MFRTLYRKLAFVLAMLLIGVLLVQAIVTMRATQAYLREANQRLYRTLAGDILAEELVETGDDGRLPVLEDVFSTLMVLNPALHIYWLDPGGRVLIHSAPPGLELAPRVSLEPIQRFLSPDARLPILGDDPRDPAEPKIFSVAPVRSGGELRGYLYVVLEGEQASTMQRLRGSPIVQITLRTLVMVSLFAAIAGLLLFRSITRRITRLNEQMTGFEREVVERASGEGDAAPGGDEIDRLERCFETLTDRIREQMRLLESADAVRRELVANVSHDLRTPLFALRGYLETLTAMETSLGPEERRRYLEAAIGHAERLSRLVDDLFELARLDAGDVQPRFERFSLGELVQDVVQKFELEAKRAGVELTADLRPELPAVRADIGLVERVLENLLDNSLRNTPSGGEVSLALRRDGGRISVVVRDSGRGIPPELLDRIFERFYRVPGGRGDRRPGMGLGLAIVQQILALHGTTLQVESTVGVGTTARFSLEAAST